MLKELINAHFPGAIVITTNQKELKWKLLDNDEEKIFLRSITSIELSPFGDKESQKIVHGYSDYLRIVIVGNSVTGELNGDVSIGDLFIIFLVPDQEEIIGIRGSRTDTSYSIKYFTERDFKKVADVPLQYKNLYKIIVELLKKSRVFIA